MAWRQSLDTRIAYYFQNVENALAYLRQRINYTNKCNFENRLGREY